MPTVDLDSLVLSEEALRRAEAFRDETKREMLTILFTDLVDSTRLQAVLGNAAASRLNAIHRTLMREAMAQFDAREIEWAGDSCLMVFRTPSDAAAFALRVQQMHAARRLEETNLPAVRIGIHLGEVLVNPSSDPGRSQELFGLQVSETARVMNAARGNQILCTRTVYDNARAALTGGPPEKNTRILWFNHGPYRLKGIEDPVEICEFGDTSIAPMKPPLESPDCRRVSMLYARNRRRTPVMLAALPAILIALAAAFGVYRILPEPGPAVTEPAASSDIVPANPALITRYRMRLPDEYPLTRPVLFDSPLALSPDGNHFAYNAMVDGVRRLVIQSRSELKGVVLENASSVDRPVFSPDGRWVAFVGGIEGSVYVIKVPVSGGAPVALAEAQFAFPLSWGDDGYIVYSPSYQVPFHRVHQDGGTPEAILDFVDGERIQSFPCVLPGSKAMLFTSSSQPHVDASNVVLYRFDTQERKILIEKAGAPKYLDSGHIVFTRTGRLMAVRFDLESLELTGNPFDVSEPALIADGSPPSRYAVSQSGTLMYAGSFLGNSESGAIAWLNDDGTHEPLDISYSGYGTIRVSPDGRRMALDAGDVGRLDIWYYDFERKTLPRLTIDPNADFAPIWLGNSETIVFESIRDGAWALYRQKISERDAELIMTFPEEQPFPNWASPDGQELLLTLIRGEISDIYKLTLEPEPTLQPILNTPFREEEAALSPGIDWIAYASNETGRMEIYVQSYPTLGSRQQVSLGGGRLPKWSPKGDRLYYLQMDGTLMVVDLEYNDDALELGAPKPYIANRVLAYDIAPGTGRVIAAIANDSNGPPGHQTELYVVDHWFEEIRQRERLYLEDRV